MNHQYENPENIYYNIKFSLEKGVKDRHHGFHTPIFSNLNLDNQISSRVVVLRKFNSDLMTVDFHSDLRSQKIDELKKNSQTNFLFYNNKEKIQLRVASKSIIHFKNSITKIAWEKTKNSSRKCYLALYPPGSPVNLPTDGLADHFMGIDPTNHESEKGYDNFSVINNQIKTIEWLHLSSKGHKRLFIKVYKEKNDYQWLIP